MERIRRLNRFKVEFAVTGNPVYFDSQNELILFRIAQEALNNIIKHAEAQNIYVRVSFNATEIKLSIQDNGKGFPYKETEKIMQKNMKAGLTNMQVRSKLISGQMKIQSEPGKGTTILVSAPLNQ
jgi:signal transduction histidine kinase